MTDLYLKELNRDSNGTENIYRERVTGIAVFLKGIDFLYSQIDLISYKSTC
jgi:hypothetical protein